MSFHIITDEERAERKREADRATLSVAARLETARHIVRGFRIDPDSRFVIAKRSDIERLIKALAQ